MRIAYFTDVSRIGGAEGFLADMAAAAVGAGHDVTVFSPQSFLLDYVHSAVSEARLVRGGVDFAAAKSRSARAGALIRGLPALPGSLSRLDADLLHVNNGGYPGSDLCRLATVAARVARVPRRLLTVHSAPWARGVSQPQLQAVADRLVWHSVDAVHATTEFVRAGLHDLRGMPANLGRYIPYGVAEPRRESGHVAALRARLLPNGGGILAGMVSATGDREKGHGVFIEALARLNANVCAVIVGPHPGDSVLDRIASLGIRDRVTVEGPVPPASIGSYLRAVDVLVVPSTAFESLPLVVLEAMAARTPVFASRLSGIPEAVIDGKTGRLFTPGAVDELAVLLAGATKDRLRLMGHDGHTRWRETFSSASMTMAMLELYEELAA
jgi:glycosyltransferase involved in cell wall biosynthesis